MVKMEAALQSREEEPGSPVMVWSGYTSAGVFISGFPLHERIYQSGWVLVTSSQMGFLTHMAGLQSRPAMILQARFPSTCWRLTRALRLPLLPTPPAPANRVSENPGAGETMPCPN